MHPMQPYLENIKKYSKTTLLVVCLLATAIFWHYRGQHTPLIAATEIPAEPLPSFQLLTTDNQALTPESFLGQWTFLFFGYTNCPDICPAMMSLMGGVANQLEEGEAQFVFVSADPRNDDLDKIESYVHAFNPRFIGATGLPDEVSTLAKSMHLFFSNADGNPDPVITHSDVLLLINPQAELVAIFNAPNDPMTVALDFRAIQRRAP